MFGNFFCITKYGWVYNCLLECKVSTCHATLTMFDNYKQTSKPRFQNNNNHYYCSLSKRYMSFKK